MLIGFVGCPASGKTTLSSRVFAELKSMSMTSEYIPEQARFYIAEKRYESNQGRGSKVVLADYDHFSIMSRQQILEKRMLLSTSEGAVVVSDGCTLNSLLYMSDEARSRPGVRELVEECKSMYDILFYTSPVRFGRVDNNRIHSEQESLSLDSKILPLLKELGLGCIKLNGDHDTRYREAIQTVLKRLLK